MQILQGVHVRGRNTHRFSKKQGALCRRGQRASSSHAVQDIHIFKKLGGFVCCRSTLLQRFGYESREPAPIEVQRSSQGVGQRCRRRERCGISKCRNGGLPC